MAVGTRRSVITELTLNVSPAEILRACPRGLLQKVLGQLSEDFEVEAMAGAEFEYFRKFSGTAK